MILRRDFVALRPSSMVVRKPWSCSSMRSTCGLLGLEFLSKRSRSRISLLYWVVIATTVPSSKPRLDGKRVVLVGCLAR